MVQLVTQFHLNDSQDRKLKTVHLTGEEEAGNKNQEGTSNATSAQRNAQEITKKTEARKK